MSAEHGGRKPELRSSQNGDAQNNVIADQLISSLTEIRGNTLRQTPVIVWQNPQIILPGISVTQEPKQDPLERRAPAVREKTKSQQYYDRRGEIISISELSNIIGVSSNVIRNEALNLKIELLAEEPRSDKRGTAHLSIEDAIKVADSLLKKKFDSQVFEGIGDELIPIQDMAKIINADVGSVVEIAGRLEIPVEVRGNQRLINRNFVEQIKASTEQRAALERLSRYSQQRDEDSEGEVLEKRSSIAPAKKDTKTPETEILEGYITVADFYETINMSQISWSRNKSKYPQVRTIRRGRFKFFNEEDAEKIKQIHGIKKLEKIAKKEKSRQLTAPPEGYINQDEFLKIIGVNNKQRWHQIKNGFSIPAMVRVGRKTYYLKTDADSIKAQRYLGKSTQSPRTFTDPKSSGVKPAKAEQPESAPITISEFAAKHNLEEGKILEIARSHFEWGLNDSSEQLSPRQQRLLSFYIEANLRTAPEGFMTVAQICKTLEISSSTWYTLKVKKALSSYKMNGGTFYKKEDVDQIANERQQKVSGRIAARVERKPAFDEEFDEMMEGNEEQGPHDLNIIGLHLKEVGQIPIEIKNHWRWNAKILVSQMAVHTLPEILKRGKLTPQQESQILAILENPVVKIILKLFQSRLDEVLSKKVLDNVTQKIGKKQKLDNANEFFINSAQNQANWIIDKLSSVERIRDSEKRESELQKLIDRQIYLINEGINARDKLTKANLRLVINIAKKYTWSGFTILELVSYGCEGLMRAAVKFDWRRGTQFSTYATPWIRQSIGRAIADHARTIRVPVHVYEKISKLQKRAEKLQQETGEDINMEDLADEVDPSGNLAKGLRTRSLASLNSAVGPDQDSFLEDFIEDVKSNMGEHLDKIGVSEAVRQALDTLPHRERRVLELRFGMVDERSRTLEEVSKVFQVTRERIRQIETKALRKLRHPSRAEKLRPYFDDDPRSIAIGPGEAANVPRRYNGSKKNS